MSNRSGFLEGLIIGGAIGVLSILVAAPNSRKEIQDKIQKIKEENTDTIEVTKEKTEDLIEKTKKSIEEGFEKLSTIIDKNNKINATDVFSKTPEKE